MSLGKKIQELRKAKGVTQNELAEKLFVSYQAVSQWENGNTNPDISILPNIAKVFNVSIDELFGESRKLSNSINVHDYNDDTLYIFVAKGNQLLQGIDYDKALNEKNKVEIHIKGDCLNVNASGIVTIEGNVQEDVNAGSTVTCMNVEGDVNAGSTVTCADVNGNVSAGSSLSCADVNGNVSASEKVTANLIEGNIECNTLYCKIIEAENIKAETINTEQKYIE